jgi:P27 family predicted phage terminase small subunit
MPGPKRGPKPKRRSRTDGGILWEGYEIPDDLELDQHREFLRLVEILRQKGNLDRTDPRIVLATVRTQGTIDEAYRELEREGLTSVNTQGTTVAHPLLAAINALLMRLRGLLNDMGLTPKSAGLTGSTVDAAESKWGSLIDAS